jgi:proteic killer suppression protein
MLVSFRHKGLAKFYRQGTTHGIQAKHAQRLRVLLGFLDVVTSPEDMRNEQFGLHRLKGRQKVRWSVQVNKNWRLTFEIRNRKVYELDYEDYH